MVSAYRENENHRDGRMTHEEEILCPVCRNKLTVLNVHGHYVSDGCVNCKSKDTKIERLLNKKKEASSTGKKSFLKLDPRG
jgi:uncharacterized CHY-type Zn-finger protein